MLRTLSTVAVIFCARVSKVVRVGVALGVSIAGVLHVPMLKAQQATPPKAVWIPTSGAPNSILTPREGELHDRFINRAQAGEIDVVFFGSTETEMWLWQDRGRSAWDQAFGSRKAENFGTQGTRFESLLWRMQNGELNGYQAKLVVLQAQGGGFTDYVSNYAAIIAEIRARQPQAKILLFGVFPRYQTHTAPAVENTALATLANNETVFFVDLSDRFFRPDGSFDTGMWKIGGVDVGMQKRAFEVWAEALQPWLARFVF